MRSLKQLFILTTLSWLVAGTLLVAAPPSLPTPLVNLPIGVVDFKECVEKSRLGKQEQVSFDELKKKMEASMQEKQKTLQEINAKLNDADYMDSLSQETEAELKHRFRVLGQELAQLEEQAYQILGQSNTRALQKLQTLVDKAAEIVAKQEGLLMIVNKEAFFYSAPQLDKTEAVVAQLDKLAAQQPSSP